MAKTEQAPATIDLNVLTDDPLRTTFLTLPANGPVGGIPEALVKTGLPGFTESFSKHRDFYAYFKVPPGILVPSPRDNAQRKKLLIPDEGYEELGSARSLSKLFLGSENDELHIVVWSKDHFVEKALLNIQKAFASFSLAEYTARMITLRVDALDKWERADVLNIENGITLLWETRPHIHNQILDDARERLRQ